MLMMMIAMMMVMMISMNGLQVKCDVADAMEVIQSTLKISLKRSEQQKKEREKRANKLDARRRRMRCLRLLLQMTVRTTD